MNEMQIRNKTDEVLAANSSFSSFVYVILFVILVSSTPIFTDRPVFCAILATLLLSAGAARFLSGAAHPLLLRTSIVATGLLWGIFCGTVITVYGASTTTALVLFPTAAISGGAIGSIAPARVTLLLYFVSLTVPIISGFFLNGFAGSHTFATLTLIHLIYCVLQGEKASRLALKKFEWLKIIEAQKAELEAAWVKAQSASVAKEEASTKDLVLIVDDNEDHLLVLRQLLLKRGYDVLCAQTATEALAMVSTRTPEFIFMDAGIPADQIRSKTPGDKIRIIALSAYPSRDQRPGVDEQLTKPVTAKTLDHVLKKWSTPG